MLLGGALLPLGGIAFVLLAPGMSPLVAGAGSIVIGLGMGFLSTSAIILIQGCVGWAERGAATASNLFARNLGSTLGATVLGAVLNYTLAHHASGTADVGFTQIRELLDHPGLIDPTVRDALGHALHLTFWAVFLVALATLLAALLVPAITLASAPERVPAE